MEERLPPPPRPPPPPTTTAAITKPDPPLETYVVQVPRDQIYRVPPPEHAHIIEHHTRNISQQKNNCNSQRFIRWAVIIVILLVVIGAASVFALRATLYNPKSPHVSVTRVQAKNLEQIVQGKTTLSPKPEYYITLNAENPNTMLSVSYIGPGKSTLFFKNQRIGLGKASSMIDRENPNGDNVDVPVIISGDGVNSLPIEFKKGLNNTDKDQMSFVLKVDLMTEFKSWARNEKRNVMITCDFKVQSLMASKKTRVSSQDCQTEF